MITANAMYTAPDDYNLFWATLTNPITWGLLATSLLCFLIFITLFVRETVSTQASGETPEPNETPVFEERRSRPNALEFSMALVIFPLSLAILGFPINMNQEFRSAQMDNITAKYIVDDLKEVEMSKNLFVAEYSTPSHPGPFKMEFNISEETGEPSAKFVTDDGAYPVEEAQESILAEITKTK